MTDPAGYDALLGDAGAYEDETRLVLRAQGSAPLKALHGLVTADLESGDRDGAWPSLVLTPKGRVLADAVIVACGGDVLVDVPLAAWSGLQEHFERYLPPRLARLEASGLRALRIRGPGALDRERNDPELARLDGPVVTDRDGSRWDVVAFRGGVATRPPGSLDLYLPADESSSFDLPPVSEGAWQAWRIERGIPLFGVDFSEENLPQETGLVSERVSFVKGCYTGQEVLARIHYRGKVNRHLRGLVADTGDGDMIPGDAVRSGAKERGLVTSAVRSPRYGPIALAMLRREVEPGDEVAVGSARASAIAARVVELPFGTA